MDEELSSERMKRLDPVLGKLITGLQEAGCIDIIIDGKTGDEDGDPFIRAQWIWKE